jgi:putative PEP-CTERM system integral membrane protein
VNGQPLDVEPDEWLPENIPASAPTEPQAHRVDLPGRQTVLAIPAGQAELPDLPAGLSPAVVIDRSRSMQTHAEEVATAIEQLQALETLEMPVDVYLTASPYRGEEPSVVPLKTLNRRDRVFRRQDAAQLIDQFVSLHSASRSDRQYDAAIVLTDGTGYELGASEVKVSVPDYPVWVVHMGDEIPLGYDDQTLEAIQASGGGVAGSLDEALARLAVASQAKSGSDSATAPLVDLVDGYLWTVLPTSQAESAIPAGAQVQVHGADDPFAALAARRLVLAEMQRQRGTIDRSGPWTPCMPWR